jgi:hypothetical protein
LGATVPEIVKQLAVGAISAPKPPAGDEEEELEDDLEADEDEESDG